MGGRTDLQTVELNAQLILEVNVGCDGFIRTDRYSTVDQLSVQMNSGATRRVSNTTVQRILLRMSVRISRLFTAPMLTTDHYKQRRQFA